MTKEQLSDELLTLRDLYPTLIREDPQQWKARVTAYHRTLRRWDIEAVKAACELAPDRYPDRFPTAGQLTGLCSHIAAKTKEELREQQARVSVSRKDKAILERVLHRRRNVIPDSVEDQERWITETDCPFEQLSRRWECESKNLGLDPTKPTPPEIHARRAKERRALMPDFAEPGWECSRERRPRRFRYDGTAPSSFPGHPTYQGSKREPGCDDDAEATPEWAAHLEQKNQQEEADDLPV